jgi:segregation and condensation protein A
LLACDPRTYAVHTEVYDGPLELLLFLVRRHGVDLRDVPIAPITDAFLEHIHRMEALDLEVAGEFLVMASTLCWLKSQELLPRAAPLDLADEDDPVAVREDLARRLLEYQRYREAAEALSQRPWLGRDTFAAVQAPIGGTERSVVAGTNPLGLLQIFYEVLQRHAADAPIHQIELEHYSLQEMAGWILGRLHEGPRELTDLLRLLQRRGDRIIAFLAALEMARLGMLDLRQGQHLGPIILHGQATPETADLGRLSGGSAG